MTGYANSLNLRGVRSIDELAAAITSGIEQGLRLPFEQFLAVAAPLGSREGARKIFEACVGIDDLEGQGTQEVAQDYRNVEQWAISLMRAAAEASPRPDVTALADATLGTAHPIIDLGGGVLYAGEPNAAEIPVLLAAAQAIPGARFFCYRMGQFPGSEFPALEIQAINDARVDVKGLVYANFVYHGKGTSGTALLLSKNDLQGILTYLGAQRSP